MKKISFLLALAACMAYAPRVYGWGSRGHKIVAQIAKSCLDKSVVDSVQYYLGSMSFEDAAVWMDEVRSDFTYDYLKPMHYINVERDKTYVKVSEPNVINELDIVIAQLQSKEPRDKDKTNLSLKILFHLVGDLHQPLHAGYGEDKGGNTIDVDFLGERSNLHKVWDTKIIEQKNITTNDCLKVINAMSKSEKSELQKINPVSWMDDSRKLLPNVYDFKNGKIDEAYVDKNVPVVELQLARAGIRLATVLNQNFKKGKEAAANLNPKPVTE